MKYITSMCSGTLNWGTDRRVSGCGSSALQTTSIYDFQKRPCTKLTGPGVSLQLSERCESRKKMAPQLTPGAWVLFKGSGQAEQLIWLGRTIYKLGWNNDCVLKNVSSGTKNIEGAAVSRNVYAINVQWYTQKVVGVLEYIVYTGAPVVQSNIYLVYSGFDEYMHQVHGSRIQVPRR